MVFGDFPTSKEQMICAVGEAGLFRTKFSHSQGKIISSSLMGYEYRGSLGRAAGRAGVETGYPISIYLPRICFRISHLFIIAENIPK